MNTELMLELDVLKQYLAKNEQRMEQMEERIEQKWLSDQSKDQTIEQLHSLAQQLTNEMFKKYMEPLVLEIINYNYYLKKKEGSNELEIVRTELNELLAKFKIVAFQSAIGDSYDPQIHQPIDFLATPEPRLNKTVAKCVKEGYSWDGKIKWREQIILYKLQ